MVSVLALYSNNLSSIRAEVYNFSVQIVVKKNKNMQKDAAVGPFLFLKKLGKSSLNARVTFERSCVSLSQRRHDTSFLFNSILMQSVDKEKV